MAKRKLSVSFSKSIIDTNNMTIEQLLCPAVIRWESEFRKKLNESNIEMSDDEIDKAVKEAAEFEAQDKKRKEAIDTRNEADSFVFQTEKALNEVGDKIDASQKSAVEADMQAVKDILERTKDQEMSDADLDALKAAKEKLTTSAQALFTKMYENMQQAGGAGPDMGAGAAGPDMSSASEPADDVVDGDYKEI